MKGEHPNASPTSPTASLALDLGIGEDEGHTLTLDARADAERFQIFEERIVVVGLGDGDPQCRWTLRSEEWAEARVRRGFGNRARR